VLSVVNNLGDFSRRVLRVSTLLRVLWLAVAALHIWLILRRCINGDWHTFADYLRAALCLVAVGYATLKVWHVTTVFDNEPRRAWIFSLVLLLGHAFASQPGDSARALQHGDTAPWVAALAILPAVGGVLLLAALIPFVSALAALFAAPLRTVSFVYFRIQDLLRPLCAAFAAPPPLRGPPAFC
jgi:hypothetical protein